MVLKYPPIAILKTLKEWKITITSVEQGHKFTESKHDYRTKTNIIYGGKGVPIDIGKFRDNFNKDGKLSCFNYNIYRHIAKDY